MTQEHELDGSLQSPDLVAFASEIAPAYAIPDALSDAMKNRGALELQRIQEMARPTKHPTKTTQGNAKQTAKTE
jgi:hypothetical protein